MGNLNPIAINSAITACLCANKSSTPSMMVLDSFTAFFCNTDANHEGRQFLENVMISRWRDKPDEALNKRCIFVTRDKVNSTVIKLLFINQAFSASFLFADESATDKETMIIRANSRTTIMGLSNAIAALDLAVNGKPARDHAYAVTGVVGTLKALGFKIERIDSE